MRAPPTETGPIHVTGEILTSKRVGGHHHLTLVAPGVGDRFRAGQYVALSVGGERLARRAMWVHRVRATGGHGLTVEVVVDTVGEGTRWLTTAAPGTRLAVTGPLGRPFSLPKQPASCVLVGHGHSAAPLFPLAERLRERECPVTLLVSGDTEQDLLSALEARRSVRSVTVVTVDGSVGLKGTIAEHLPDLLRTADADVVYAAGRPVHLHAVARAAEDHGAWSQTALEHPVTCGTGLCHGCAVPVIGENTAQRFARACHDGPVFRGDRVQWEALA